MRYILFFLGVIFWLVFSYDIEYSRDFLTWQWLLLSGFFFVNSYVKYNHDMNNKKIKSEKP